jgi:predicted house-cleaning noncanonical NTP pyrophosphatase (MazG superfamily)
MVERRDGRVFYRKLVTDGVIRRMKIDGVRFEARRVDADEFRTLLFDKLVEEAKEVRVAKDSRPKLIKEMLDLLSVIQMIEVMESFADSDIGHARVLRHTGGDTKFKNRWFLEWSEDDGYEDDKHK